MADGDRSPIAEVQIDSAGVAVVGQVKQIFEVIYLDRTEVNGTVAFNLKTKCGRAISATQHQDNLFSVVVSQPKTVVTERSYSGGVSSDACRVFRGYQRMWQSLSDNKMLEEFNIKVN